MNESLTPAELGEQIAGASYMLGIVSGYDEITKFLLEVAGDMFSQGNDERAHFYRDLAIELERCAKSKREQYDKKYRFEQEDAFRKLEMAANGE